MFIYLKTKTLKEKMRKITGKRKNPGIRIIKRT